jgi:hypothetical protein
VLRALPSLLHRLQVQRKTTGQKTRGNLWLPFAFKYQQAVPPVHYSPLPPNRTKVKLKLTLFNKVGKKFNGSKWYYMV